MFCLKNIKIITILLIDKFFIKLVKIIFIFKYNLNLILFKQLYNSKIIYIDNFNLIILI